MRKKIKILQKLQGVLWSYDVRDLDLKRDKECIITQVLNYGDWEDLKLLFKLYPEKEIKKVVKTLGEVSGLKKCSIFGLQFLILNLKKRFLKGQFSNYEIFCLNKRFLRHY